jgi:DNA-binding protein YbaB
MNSLIEIRRRRIVLAKLNSMERKTGSHYVVVKLPDSEVATIEVNEEILTKALIKVFEAMVFDANKRVDAERHISDHYSACMSNKLNKLSPMGMEFINAVIANLAEQAFEHKGESNERLSENH